MSSILRPPNEDDPRKFEPASARAGPGRGIMTLWLAVAILAVYAVRGVQSTRSRMHSRFGEVDKNVAALQAGAASLETRLSKTRSQLEEGIGATREELDRARALARRNRVELRHSAERLGGAIDEQKSELGSLIGKLDGVKTGVTVNRRDIDRAIGDLGEQAGLIARNQKELDALRRRGEREYFEFDLGRSGGLRRVGPVSLRLNKTDTDKQRYTMTVLLDDKLVEKKDKTLLEPVQFYVRGSRSVIEVVAQEVGDGRVVGYVSAPKQVVPRSS